jgi:hypothetical protein
METHICFKKKRTLSLETLDSNTNNEYNQLLQSFNDISVDNNTKLIKEGIDKINKLGIIIEKLDLKINNLEQKIVKILLEKDNIIESLKDELYYCREDLKDLKEYINNKPSNNDYFC